MKPKKTNWTGHVQIAFRVLERKTEKKKHFGFKNTIERMILSINISK
jgi:hypothetical protein